MAWLTKCHNDFLVIGVFKNKIIFIIHDIQLAFHLKCMQEGSKSLTYNYDIHNVTLFNSADLARKGVGDFPEISKLMRIGNSHRYSALLAAAVSIHVHVIVASYCMWQACPGGQTTLPSGLAFISSYESLSEVTILFTALQATCTTHGHYIAFT